MAFAITETEVELPYRYNHLYYERGNDFRKLGNQQAGFTDANIVEITNYAKGKDRREVGFYKERLYPAPDHIIFTIFDVEENLIMTELHVILSEKRSYWRVNRPCRVPSDISVRLKIIQNPNLKTYLWTGLYA